MDRRTFLKTLASLGASIALPFELANASTEEIDAVWKSVTQAWGLFEINEHGTLSYANFEEPKTRREAYWYSDVSDFDADEIERRWSLCENIKDIYRNALTEAADNIPFSEDDDYDSCLAYEAIDERVEEEWATWFNAATGKERVAIEAQIERWLDEKPDWCHEWEDLYKSGTAQGAAYDHFLMEDSDVMDALGIVIIEGECPGSSYFAAELHMAPEEANAIAEARGWEIRFVTEA